MGKILTDAQRKDCSFMFAVVDATVLEYGSALLDCGHESDGSCIAHDANLGIVMCHECADKMYAKDKQVAESFLKEIQKCRSCDSKKKQEECATMPSEEVIFNN